MRKDEIVVGGTYSNGKEGRKEGIRRVIGAGPQFNLYSSQEDTDCVGYAVVQGRKDAGDRGKTPAGESIGHCTRTSFAAWAKKRVEDAASDAA